MFIVAPDLTTRLCSSMSFCPGFHDGDFVLPRTMSEIEACARPTSDEISACVIPEAQSSCSSFFQFIIEQYRICDCMSNAIAFKLCITIAIWIISVKE